MQRLQRNLWVRLRIQSAVSTYVCLGPTPVTRILRKILHIKRDEIQRRNLLIILATDGLPTDDNGLVDITSFEHVLEKERIPINKIPMTIIACTSKFECDGEKLFCCFCMCLDDSEIMNYLNSLDKRVPYLDVVDDYKNEREEILRIQGRDFPFTFGDVRSVSIVFTGQFCFVFFSILSRL